MADQDRLQETSSRKHPQWKLTTTKAISWTELFGDLLHGCLKALRLDHTECMGL